MIDDDRSSRMSSPGDPKRRDPTPDPPPEAPPPTPEEPEVPRPGPSQPEVPRPPGPPPDTSPVPEPPPEAPQPRGAGWLALSLIGVLWSCSSEPYVPEVPRDHPAHPEAPVSAYEAPADELAEPIANEDPEREDWWKGRKGER